MTHAPGLIGALLVGLSSAKALAAVHGLPLVPVDHLHGHVVASTLRPDPIEPPYLCLVASGGHTFLARVDDPARYERLGGTLDDAAGEAFDKGARLLGLGLSGRPGDRPPGAGWRSRGVRSSRAPRPASSTSASAASRPRSSTGCASWGGRDRSRRGGPRRLLPARDRGRARGARGRALEREGLDRLAIGGGVAANSELRTAVAGIGADGLGPAARAVHRQRRDDRRGGPIPRAAAVSGLSGPGRVRAGRLSPQGSIRDSSRSSSRSIRRRTSSPIAPSVAKR